MKFKMAENSLFSVLLRSPWWISAAIAAVLALVAAALLPAEFRVVGAVSALPFAVISAMAARRQWRLPNAAQVSQTLQSVGRMAWPEFAQTRDEAFRRQGYTVERGSGAAVDFELQRQGRRTLVCAKRWKSARVGLEPLR
ncbi:MAG TPA: restriction endonuclease, partial [Rubrivivax sp.]|nr:restriction endonuclease [Rubrivivax sp.]